MITNLISKQNKYICGNCRMQQPKICPSCYFCGASFSNYEEVILENFLFKEKNEIKNTKSS